MRSAIAALVLLGAVACGGTQGPRPRDEPVIGIKCAIASAVVVLNNRELGTVRSLRSGIRLSPGTHRLVVRHPDYHTHYQILELSLRERRIIEVELAEKLH